MCICIEDPFFFVQKQGASVPFSAKKRIWLHFLDAKGFFVCRNSWLEKAQSLWLVNTVILQGLWGFGDTICRTKHGQTRLGIFGFSRISRFWRGHPCRAPRWKKKLFFVQILGGEKLSKFGEKCRWNIFKRPERGLNIFQTRFGSFFGSFFRVFQTVFRIDLKVFRGQFRSARVPP